MAARRGLLKPIPESINVSIFNKSAVSGRPFNFTVVQSNAVSGICSYQYCKVVLIRHNQRPINVSMGPIDKLLAGTCFPFG